MLPGQTTTTILLASNKHIGQNACCLLACLACSPGGSVGTRIRTRTLADGPPVVFVESVVLEPEGGHAAAPGPEQQQLPPVVLPERRRPLPEPSDRLVARAEASAHLIHVPVGGNEVDSRHKKQTDK